MYVSMNQRKPLPRIPTFADLFPLWRNFRNEPAAAPWLARLRDLQERINGEARPDARLFLSKQWAEASLDLFHALTPPQFREANLQPPTREEVLDDRPPPRPSA